MCIDAEFKGESMSDREELKRLALAAQKPKHQNSSIELSEFHDAASPAAILDLLAQLEAKEAEIARLKTAQSHTAMQATLQHMEANTQASIVKSVLAALGLPLRDWEAESLIVGKFNELRASRDADIERAIRLALAEADRCNKPSSHSISIVNVVLSKMKEPT